MSTPPQDNQAHTGDTGFTQDAWRHVSIEAADALELLGKRNRGHLQVTIVNGSGQVLQTDRGKKLYFAFRVLDKAGKIIPCETVHTPLHASVAAGARHTQSVAVIIPGAKLSQAVSVRLGLLRQGDYWVERINPQHPKIVQISLQKGLSPADERRAAASQIWQRGKGNGLRWPYGSMMVAESHKLLYIPVAKCACTSLKSLMVKLANIELPEMALELGVHMVTDRFNTGVQLKDRPIDVARAILASDQYFKFSVIRDPFKRLVSAYLEKFVYNRHSLDNLRHTKPVIAQIQGTTDIDLERGISFNQFLEYIIAQDPFDLDPHWRPQHHYFLGVPYMSRIFRLENIGELEQYLLQNHGVTVQLAHQNKTRKSDALLAGAAELDAVELDKHQGISPDSFLSNRHDSAIRDYYHQDFEFYSCAN